MKNYLGLDLGTTSVGWALIKKGKKGSGSLIDGGVRIFSTVTEAKTGVPKNQARRAARGARVNIRRRRKRRTALKSALVESGLLPKEVLDPTVASDALNAIGTNPYELRSRALKSTLSDDELGRAFLHLGMRRGFLSNRKTGEDNESKVVGAAITELSENIKKSGAATLGEYLATQPTQRGRDTQRAMYQQEFESIWKQQSKTNSKLTPELKEKLLHYVFFQNPLKIQKYLVGECALEEGKKRAAKWQPIAQTLRVWLDVSRIKTTHDNQPLPWEQQQLLVNELHLKKTMKWKAVRKLLKLNEEVKLNLEESGALKELKGNPTTYDLGKALGEGKDKLADNDISKILNWLDTSDNDAKLREKIERGYSFPEPVVVALMKCSLTKGYFHLSVKACNKLVDVFESNQTPLTYRTAAELAGYQMDEMGDGKGLDFLPEPPVLRNPVVEKALVELRKVVNGIIRKYGKPDKIRLEMARDLKNPKKVRDEIQKHNRDQEKKRGEAREILQADFAPFKNTEPNRDDIEKYLLWKECFEDSAGQCPYTGKIIPRDSLFTQEVQVEHIIPYSRSLDNSFNNKTLCFAEENARKGNQTPYELYNGTEQYEDVLGRTAKLPYSKRRRFSRKDVPDYPEDNRTLNDTRYICKEAKQYLQKLGTRVQVSTGQVTAGLRRKWNLNGILQDNGANLKNREDHRHHFIDAIIIANISLGIVKLISTICADERIKRSLQGGIFGLKSVFDEPWKGFRDDVEQKANEMVISHSPTRKVSGGLHEGYALGKVKTPEGEVFTRRVKLDKTLGKAFSIGRTNVIADPVIRRLVEERLAAHGDSPKEAFADLDANPLMHVDGHTVIKRVRIRSNDSPRALFARAQNGEVYAYYRKGNNYKVAIYQMPDGKWKGHYISAFDAKSGNDLAPEEFKKAKSVMELCKNDMVEMDWENGRACFRLGDFSEPNLVFRLHYSNQTDYDKKTLKKVSTNKFKGLNPRKIEVSPIGEVTYVSSQQDS